MKCTMRGLYAVTPDGLDDADLLERVESALQGGAALVQYRNKRDAAVVRRRQAEALLQLCRRYVVPLVINDHVDLAAAIGAHGVHLGMEDGDVAQARAQLGPEVMIGASCYNQLEMAHAAERAGADYVAFGSFFSSATKPAAVRASLDLLGAAKRGLSVPVVAIGGITHDNAPQLLRAGADSIAVISAVFDAADVCSAAMRLSTLFGEVRVQ